MSIRTWIFAALVALGMALNLGLVSLRIAQTGEETVRARVAAASVALKTQLDLLDARLSPKAVAANPDLIEATRSPVDPTQPLARPDERALRAAASVVAPEPDLLMVVTGQGAIVSRRGKPAASLDDLAPLPLAKAALAGSPAPSFVAYDNGIYRVSAARVPGNAAAVIVGMLVDDRLAAQLRSQVDADVSLLQGDKLLASSLPAQGESRAQLQRWVKAPAPGFGVLPVRLPILGSALSGKLPRGTSRWATRGALVPLDSGVLAAVTVPASAYLGWLGRYQAFYLFALALFVLLGFVWGLVSPRPAPVQVVPAQGLSAQRRGSTPPPLERSEPSQERSEPSLLGADVSANTTPPKPVPPADVPWSSPPDEGKHDSLDPLLAPQRESAAFSMGETASASRDTGHSRPPSMPAAPDEPELGELKLPGDEEPALDPIWHGDPFSTSAGQFVVPTPEPEVPGLQVQQEERAALAPGAASQPSKDFSFAGLLDEAQAAGSEQQRAAQPSVSQDFPDRTNPGRPSDELLARSRDEKFAGFESPTEAPFPGDEPTRIEPISAALLDKLRERDEEMSAAADPELARAERVAREYAAAKAAEAERSAQDQAETQPADDEQAALEEAAAAHSAADHHDSDAAAAEHLDDESAGRAAAEESAAEQGALEQAAVEQAAADQAAVEEAAADQAAADQAAADQAAADEAAAEQAAAARDASRNRPLEHRPAQPSMTGTLIDFRPHDAPAEGTDSDEQHWQETFDQFRQLKARLGEPADRITFEKFAAKLRKNRQDLLAKHSCKGVRFSVYEKEGKAAIKASAIR